MTSTRRLAFHGLASGSRGNAALIEDRVSTARLVIDCGICKRDFFSRSAALGQDLGSVCGLVISHDHSDHTKGLGVVLRGLVWETGPLPLYTSERIRRASGPVREVIDQGLVDYRPLTAGVAFRLGPFEVLPFATSHDAAESFGFRVTMADGAGDSLGYMTDTGVVSPEAMAALSLVRLLAIESNHDVQMLETGPYPALLKERVASERGHLSNDQAAAVLGRLAHPGLEQVVAMHVSQNNNTYDLAVKTLARALAKTYPNITVQAAYQDRPISVY